MDTHEAMIRIQLGYQVAQKAIDIAYEIADSIKLKTTNKDAIWDMYSVRTALKVAKGILEEKDNYLNSCKEAITEKDDSDIDDLVDVIGEMIEAGLDGDCLDNINPMPNQPALDALAIQIDKRFKKGKIDIKNITMEEVADLLKPKGR